MKKRLLDMLRDSNVILEKAISLQEQSRIAIEECSEDIDVASCGNEGNVVPHM